MNNDLSIRKILLCIFSTVFIIILCIYSINSGVHAEGRTCTVTWDAGEGFIIDTEYDENGYPYEVYTDKKIKTVEAEINKPITECDYCNRTNVYSKNNKILVGWRIDGKGKIYYMSYVERFEGGTSGDTIILTGDITLVAVWEDPVTVTYDPNGGVMSYEGYFDYNVNKYVDGSNIMTKTSFKYHSGQGLEANVFVDRPGYFFEGWRIVGEKSVITYSMCDDPKPNDIYVDDYIIKKNITLKAIWKKECKVRFVTNEGNLKGVKTATSILPEGYKLSDIFACIPKDGPNEIEIDEYRYKNRKVVGWKYSIDGKVYANDELEKKIIKSDITLTAVWADKNQTALVYISKYGYIGGKKNVKRKFIITKDTDSQIEKYDKKFLPYGRNGYYAKGWSGDFNIKTAKWVKGVDAVRLCKVKLSSTKVSSTQRTVITVKYKGKKLSKKFYRIHGYSNGDLHGKAWYEIKFRNGFYGMIIKEVELVPDKIVDFDITPEKNSVLVNSLLRYETAERTGNIEIQYSTDKRFKKNVKTLRKKTKAFNLRLSGIEYLNTRYLRIKGLKSNKKYYFRIRQYATTKGKRHYSFWSPVKCYKTL